MRKVGLYEATLKAKERKELPDNLFGLPKERKYPLHDEAHVRKAIQFFKFCEPSKRNELAVNINKKIKEYKLDIKVSKDNPFHIYTNNSSITTESSYSVYNDDYEWNEYNGNIDIDDDDYHENLRRDLKIQLGINDPNVEDLDDDFIYKAESLNGLFDVNDIKLLTGINNLSFVMSEVEVYAVTEIFNLVSVLCGFDIHNTTIYYGARDYDDFVIIAYIPDENIFCLIDIDDLIINSDNEIENEYLKVIRPSRYFNAKNYDDIDSVTEGISISKNGDIKIVFSPKKSYMDEYAENHRVLKSNLKNGNYDAMKYNIAFAFMMISIIERDPKYKSKDPDIMKARQFFINDFVMYNDEVVKHDTSFDFSRYYYENEFDKYILNIPIGTIYGIKQILKALIS